MTKKRRRTAKPETILYWCDDSLETEAVKIAFRRHRPEVRIFYGDTLSLISGSECLEGFPDIVRCYEDLPIREILDELRSKYCYGIVYEEKEVFGGMRRLGKDVAIGGGGCISSTFVLTPGTGEWKEQPEEKLGPMSETEAKKKFGEWKRRSSCDSIRNARLVLHTVIAR